jgi:hypothetical protein
MKKCYNYNKESLPRPILDGRDDFINLYYQAWTPFQHGFFKGSFIDNEDFSVRCNCINLNYNILLCYFGEVL